MGAARRPADRRPLHTWSGSGLAIRAVEFSPDGRTLAWGGDNNTVVLEDLSYSLIKLSQESKKLEPYRTDFNPIDSVKMAEACGVEGVRTANPDELAIAAKRAIDRRRSIVIAVPVNYADYRPLF